MHKNHEPEENVLFSLFTWLPFQIVFFSAHQCKETNYDQTEIIKKTKKKRNNVQISTFIKVSLTLSLLLSVSSSSDNLQSMIFMNEFELMEPEF